MNIAWTRIRCNFKYQELKMKLFRSRKEEIVKVSPDDLLEGQIINSAKNDVAWYNIPVHGIRLYQFIRWGKKWKDDHTVYYVGKANGKFKVPHVFEVTLPRAKYTPLSEILEGDCTFNVYAYAHALPGKDDLKLMLEVCDEINGTYYDVGELLDFMIQQILGYPPDSWHSWFDMGKKNLVCSVGVMTIIMKWYNEKLKPLGLPRPGGDAHVERCDPATFANHPTFVHIGQLI